ncbi:MAG: sulfatase-like hydrolase/transferase [Chloroflexi bacterium]|nr:sulfatase-like hydrolase/transferase [Chloroflexota bacterium]
MTDISRRDFLKLLPALPFFKVAWPYVETAVHPHPQTQNSGQPNILVLVFDTLSARHLSMFGYQRETTPNIARFADKATVFHNHTASANFTSPGTASMLTGTHPWTHRAFHLHDLIRQDMASHNIFNVLPDNYYKAAYSHNLLVMSLLHQFREAIDAFTPTRELCLADGQLADRLFYEDYTPAYWGESTILRHNATPPGTLFLSTADRLMRFANKNQVTEAYGDLYPRGIPNLHSLFFILEDAIDWIGAQVAEMSRPYFSYFHLLPPHEPYTTHRDFINKFKDGWQPAEKEKRFGSHKVDQGNLNEERRLYDEYLAFTDAEFGRLINNLEQDGLLDNTYLILTSDHGELFERGIRGHVTATLWDPITHVPLFIRAPGQTKRTDVFTRTSAVDLLPTIAHLTAQPVPDWAEGQILPTMNNDLAAASERDIWTMEAKSNAKMAPLTKASLALFQDEYKLVHYFGYSKEDEFQMYNLADDPEELTDIVNSESVVAAAMKQTLLQKLEEVNQR